MIDIKGWEGLYAITSCGKLWSYRRKRFLYPYVQNGYQLVTLCDKGRYRQTSIHQLVAETYVPKQRPEQNQVHHKDRVHHHNWANNLEWMTAKEHALHHDALHIFS